MITIIGAGVIGLAVAAQVAGKGHEVYILEKNETFGQETSSRNSETIHAGIYYEEGSLKAETCVAGSTLLYELCQQHGIPYRKTGKLIVATRDEEVEKLAQLLEQGKRNGVDNLSMLSRREVKELEPNVEADAAILSPSSGVIDSHALMRFFHSKTKEKGVEIAYKAKAVGIERLSDGYEVEVQDSSSSYTFKTEIIINCAGLYSDIIAQLTGIDIDEAGYKLRYCIGEYFSVSNRKSKMVERLIYPVPPGTGGLGIHTVLDVEGRMRLGPNARFVNEIDYKVDESQQKSFHDSVKGFLPFIEYNDLAPEMAGIRPKLQGPGENFRDFIIRHEKERGLPGFINLIGIESPGLTSSPAIAKHVERLINEML
ncbi:NAD(P)/FAD-dependent oxidoreductase [Chloroflexota bacterium]